MSENTEQFHTALRDEGYVTYERNGEAFGVYYGQENRKMRFSRLGLSKDHFQALDQQYERLQELEQLREPGQDRSFTR